MKIFVTAKAGAHEAKITKIDDTHFIIFVKERAENGKANDAIRRGLADYFDVPVSRVEIIRGESARQKTIEIDSCI